MSLTSEKDDRIRPASWTLRYSMIIGLFITLFACQSSASSLCAYSKQKGLFTADCSNKRIANVPQDVRSETEVLDLSYNELQYLHNNSFDCCTAVKLLYLQHNIMSIVEFNVFARLTSLTVLDLSYSGLLKLPYLPGSLQKLYLNSAPLVFMPTIGHNPMIQISRLTLLDTLHLSENRLERFPEFVGLMVNLLKLNITNNTITDISVDQLARLCQLKYLYTDPMRIKNTDSEEKYCSCLELRNWTSTHHIQIQGSSICELSGNTRFMFSCDLTLRNSTQEIYRQCIADKNAGGKQRYFLFGVCSAIIIVAFFVLYYVCCERRKSERTAYLSNPNDSATHIDIVDSEAMEEKCTNPAFDSHRIQHVYQSQLETAV